MSKYVIEECYMCDGKDPDCSRCDGSGNIEVLKRTNKYDKE